MNIKEILKPTKSKLIIFIILLILLKLSITIINGNYLELTIRQYTTDILLLILALPAIFLPISTQPITGYSLSITSIVLYSIVLIIWNYLLACIINIIYEKVKK